jgi:hypothetical protein
VRPPLEYGDNFPVPSGVWNPAEPWRFPKHEILPSRHGLLSYALPWITLGLGVSLGVLWMSWRTALVGMQPEPDVLKRPQQEEVLRFPASAPAPRPVKARLRSRLA